MDLISLATSTCHCHRLRSRIPCCSRCRTVRYRYSAHEPIWPQARANTRATADKGNFKETCSPFGPPRNQRAQITLICLDRDPTDCLDVFERSYLPPQQPPDLGKPIIIRQAIRHPRAAPAPVKRHHQSRLLPRASPAVEQQTKRAMPPSSNRPAAFDGVEVGFPDQGPVSKNPQGLSLAFEKYPLSDSLQFDVTQRWTSRIWAEVLFLPEAKRDKLGGQDIRLSPVINRLP